MARTFMGCILGLYSINIDRIMEVAPERWSGLSDRRIRNLSYCNCRRLQRADSSEDHF